MNHPLFEKLYDFQKEGVKFLLKNRTALLADEVGVGKTAQALMAVQECGAKSTLIISPASIKFDYPYRAEKWGFDRSEVHIITPQNARDIANFQHGLFVMNYDISHRKEVARYFARRQYDVFIADESHYLKSQKSRRSKAAFGAGGYVSLAKRTWFLTGTPMLNRPEELFTTLQALCPERIAPYNDYISFTVRYCGGHKGQWGWVADGATHTQELAKKLEGFMLRRELDVLPELPEKIMRVIHLEQTKEIEKLLYEERTDQENMSVRQRMGLAKVPEIIKYVSEQLDEQPKVVVFAYHKLVISKLYDELAKFGVVAITGDDGSKMKNEKVQSFIHRADIRVLIAQVDAAGTGIDGLQGVCRLGIFAEISYVPGINSQAMGRLHRNGQKHKTIFDFLTVSGSIDENILDQNVFKSGVIKTIMQDEGTMFNFTKPGSEESEGDFMDGKKVSVRLNFDAIFDAEKMDKLVAGVAAIEGVTGVQCSLSYTVDASAPAIVPEVVPAAPKATPRKRGAAVPTQAVPAPEAPSVFDSVSVPTGVPAEAPQAPTPAPAPVAPTAPLTYEQRIRGAAALIQEKVGAKDPLKINQVLGELNAAIKAAFPQYSHCLLIKELEQQKQVIALINKFMKDKGFTS